MEGIITVIVRLIQAGERAYARKWTFLGFFACAFLGSVLTLGAFDLLPQASPSPARADAAGVSASDGRRAETPGVPEQPVKIGIPVLGLSADIMNPTTTEVAALDRELLKGAVRYPTSARLGEDGNVVLFGHSSYLPVVGNRAYKTFNGIQKLAAGDAITVYSSGVAYTYRVRSVARESAKRDEGIPLEISGRTLTLVTCNSFGAKEDRFVVTADFVESRAISG